MDSVSKQPYRKINNNMEAHNVETKTYLQYTVLLLQKVVTLYLALHNSGCFLNCWLLSLHFFHLVRVVKQMVKITQRQKPSMTTETIIT